MPHGNETENTSFLDVCFALKNNVFRTLNVADVCVVREIYTNSFKCEYITNSDTYIECVKLESLTLKIDDVVLVVFTNNDFRASLNAYKSGQANTNATTQTFHDMKYGIIVGVVYRRNKDEEEEK